MRFALLNSSAIATACARLLWVAIAMAAGIVMLFAGPAFFARNSLGIYSACGAFHVPVVLRCYAIAMAEPSTLHRKYQPYAAIGTWPKRAVRN